MEVIKKGNSMRDKSENLINVLVIIFACFISVFVYPKYLGNFSYYLFFTISFNLLLLLGFDKGRSFFDLFIGIFFYLGFWFKYSLKIAFADGLGYMGNFNPSNGAEHDRALLVSIVAAAALIIASLIRRKFMFSGEEVENRYFYKGLFSIYERYRKLCIGAFLILMCALPALNAYLGIYQRGSVPRTYLPFGLNGIMTWLIFFGVASIFTLLFSFEVKIKKKISLPYVVMGMTEVLFSNLSMLSRGIVLNGSALFFGINELFRRENIKGRTKFNLTLVISGFLIIIVAVTAIEFMRTVRYDKEPDAQKSELYSLERIPKMLKYNGVLFLDRWVGIDGVMAVSSYDHLGKDLWKEAWAEKFQDSGTSMFDTKIVRSEYLNKDLADKHFISLPGITGFLFYLNNYYFLFGMMIVVGLIGGAIELFVFRFGGNNVLLCSLLSQVVAYRFVHFGYAPGQSYKLFGTIFLNVIIFYVANKLIVKSQLIKSEIHEK